MAGIAVKHNDSRMRGFHILGAHVLHMNSRSLHAREIQVKAFGMGYLKAARHQLKLLINSPHLCQSTLPIFIEIRWAWIRSFIGFQLF
ncbi:hypothetical protein D3C78_1407600 [compost metagenome]